MPDLKNSIVAPATEVFCHGRGAGELSARYPALKLKRIGKRSRVSSATVHTYVLLTRLRKEIIGEV
ncbi:hypothetical protein QR77_37600 [Streptomyces sp. 150FB]|uniref:hypothetical protein n=1 Tax=Streptomyces sp. 150FB TaxID=1576605 RepID=UPI0005890410|nr:hypothetical protein [Streptomyces sp. 150FB]KIF77998.1 hypothetical protein QR77_37600 [Streptomyces sp. 150FB]